MAMTEEASVLVSFKVTLDDPRGQPIIVDYY
jgi:hypothetical protein